MLKMGRDDGGKIFRIFLFLFFGQNQKQKKKQKKNQKKIFFSQKKNKKIHASCFSKSPLFLSPLSFTNNCSNFLKSLKYEVNRKKFDHVDLQKELEVYGWAEDFSFGWSWDWIVVTRSILLQKKINFSKFFPKKIFDQKNQIQIKILSPMLKQILKSRL